MRNTTSTAPPRLWDETRLAREHTEQGRAPGPPVGMLTRGNVQGRISGSEMGLDCAHSVNRACVLGSMVHTVFVVIIAGCVTRQTSSNVRGGEREWHHADDANVPLQERHRRKMQATTPGAVQMPATRCTCLLPCNVTYNMNRTRNPWTLCGQYVCT